MLTWSVDPYPSAQTDVLQYRVYNAPRTYVQGFLALCFSVLMSSVFVEPYDTFTHICQGCVSGAGVKSLRWCQWSNSAECLLRNHKKKHIKYIKSNRMHIPLDIWFVGVYQMSKLASNEHVCLDNDTSGLVTANYFKRNGANCKHNHPFSA